MLLDRKVPFSYIIGKIRVELIYITITGVLVYYLTTAFENVIPPIPLAIPTFLGTAISVVLSFKLSQSYDRWWEARKIWGTIVNDSRNLTIQLFSFVVPGNEEAIKQIIYRQIAWCYCLGQSLRGLDPTQKLEKYISSEEVKSLHDQTNKPLALLNQNAAEIAALNYNNQLDRFSHIQINNMIVGLTNSMGMAERIKSTIFPVTYRLFLHMVIYVFIVTLSIALRDLESYFEIPLLLLVASFFFLLERTATHLQDPFSNKPTDTAMTAIATNIEINLKQLLKERNVPEPQQPNGFYLN